jgi:hypothetical protein
MAKRCPVNMGIKNRLTRGFYNNNIARNIFKYYVGAWTTVTSRIPIGTNIYERDWDTLLILDTCRIDALRQVAPEYDFISGIESIVSVGSTSNEWMANTFTETYLQEVNKTAYVSANGYSSRVFEDRLYPEVHMDGKHHPPSWPKNNICEPEDFARLDQVWRYAPQDNPGHTLPEYVMDRAISVNRSGIADREVIHFNQPHAPYIATALSEDRELHDHEESPFDALRDGVSKSVIWEAYLDNLRMALDQIEILLANISAEKVVITADHGEAFGEWGMYGHLPGMLHPHVKQVPWATTSATDTEGYEPTLEPSETGRNTEEHLRALGYK